MLNQKHKDRVFKFIFSNREWTLDLYNAINGSDYKDPNDIIFNTIENAIFMGMNNDVSFILMNEMNLWEHQSSYNPNMPLRIFLYAAQLYEKYIQVSDYNRYSTRLQKLPRPKCICFYNGTTDHPEKQILKLSDAFDGEGDIEVRVTMLNINYGKNQELMNACKPLKEYSWLVDSIRRNHKNNLEEAVEQSINEMPDDFVIKKFILGHKAEVKGMFITEWDQEKFLEQQRKEGVEEGIELGIENDRQRVARDMLVDKYPISAIAKISKLSEDVIKNLAGSLGVALT